ncbi:hypothetical protein D9M70_302380 [compost metagenome]
MVGRAVTLDTHQISARLARVAHGQVDEEASNSDLRFALIAVTLQSFNDRHFEITVWRALAFADMRHATGFGEMEEVAQSEYAAAGCASSDNVTRSEGREYLHALLGSGEKHVEAAPPVRTGNGAEALRNGAADFHWAIGGGDVNDVALVTLDVFQVLDEQRFAGLLIAVKRSLQFRILLGELLQCALDLFCLFEVHCDDAE